MSANQNPTPIVLSVLLREQLNEYDAQIRKRGDDLAAYAASGAYLHPMTIQRLLDEVSALVNLQIARERVRVEFCAALQAELAEWHEVKP